MSSHVLNGQILVVEDDPSVHAFVTRALEHAGHKVTAVQDGEIALQLLSQKTFDVIVTDIVLPGLNNGLMVAQKAVRLYPQTRVIIISGHASERSKANALNEAVFAVLPKPFTLQDIQDAVTMAVRDVRAEQAA